MGEILKIAIIGTGNVGKAIGEALRSKGYEVAYGSRNPQSASMPQGVRVTSQAEAAKDSDVIILAVPYLALKETIHAVGKDNFKDKVVIDATNVMDKNMKWALGFKTSGAEELSKELKHAKVVKAFNTVFSQHMGSGNVNGEQLDLLIASDHDDAKTAVREIGEKLGFNVVDAGPLESARLLEALGMLNIHLGYVQKVPFEGIKLVRKA
jgi:hypothetical protein